MKLLWLKTKLRNWLGIQEAEAYFCREIDDLERKYNLLIDDNLKLENENRALRERNEFILKNFRIAVDHNPYENQSWAVVCVDGKPDYVKFVSLTNRETREVMEYLSRFDRGSRIWDSPAKHLKFIDFK
ncbi:hypothetical protein pW2_43 [Bacillus phage pW2]|uniref:Uncharacterized protein n=1 Tax=Bacillus phage pW2 TaxID=2500559 RepID=A0A3Q9R7D5_9CAUD|nr:hypothetical protein PQE69_gp028 [Bacillus phage pW2]AZU98881.1 hypothetical protein pW2_43 [Bacillus phage pW2]